MACSVVTAVRLWLQDRLEEMAAFSSRVLNGRTRDAASPDRCKMGWTSSMVESLMSATREALLAAWRATEKSRKLLAVSAFCAYMTAEENSTEHEPCELLHADHDGSTFDMVAKTHHELEDSNGGGEGRMALVDTACTSCMHSKAWRIAYSKTLPEGYQCERTERTKLFHFADGSNTGSTIHLWRIPLFMGDRPGEVFSAEVETGTTPLLLSIPALIALDAVIHMREKRINLRSLGEKLEPSTWPWWLATTPVCALPKMWKGPPKQFPSIKTFSFTTVRRQAFQFWLMRQWLKSRWARTMRQTAHRLSLGQGAFEKMTSLVSLVTAEVLSWPMPWSPWDCKMIEHGQLWASTTPWRSRRQLRALALLFCLSLLEATLEWRGLPQGSSVGRTLNHWICWMAMTFYHLPVRSFFFECWTSTTLFVCSLRLTAGSGLCSTIYVVEVTGNIFARPLAWRLCVWWNAFVSTNGKEADTLWWRTPQPAWLGDTTESSLRFWRSLMESMWSAINAGMVNEILKVESWSANQLAGFPILSRFWTMLGRDVNVLPESINKFWVQMPRACAVVRLHATHQLYVELFAKVCYRPWSWTMPVLVLRVIWLTPTFQNPMPRERAWRLKSPWMVTIGSSKAMRSSECMWSHGGICLSLWPPPGFLFRWNPWQKRGRQRPTLSMVILLSMWWMTGRRPVRPMLNFQVYGLAAPASSLPCRHSLKSNQLKQRSRWWHRLQRERTFWEGEGQEPGSCREVFGWEPKTVMLPRWCNTAWTITKINNAKAGLSSTTRRSCFELGKPEKLVKPKFVWFYTPLMQGGWESRSLSCLLRRHQWERLSWRWQMGTFCPPDGKIGSKHHLHRRYDLCQTNQGLLS